MRWILPLGLLIFFELLADIFAKQFSLNGKLSLAIGALAGYLICNSFWLIALRNGVGLSRGAMIFSLASAIGAVLLGVILFEEKLTDLQMIGAFLGSISLILLFW